MSRMIALASAALAAAGCGGDASPRAELVRSADAAVLAYVWDGSPSLVRLDAATLRPAGPSLGLAEPPSAWARSPGGDRLALGSGDGGQVAVIDLERMRVASLLDLGANGYVADVSWTMPNRVIAALTGLHAEVVVLDPDTGRAVARHRLPGPVSRWARTPDGLVLLLSNTG